MRKRLSKALLLGVVLGLMVSGCGTAVDQMAMGNYQCFFGRDTSFFMSQETHFCQNKYGAIEDATATSSTMSGPAAMVGEMLGDAELAGGMIGAATLLRPSNVNTSASGGKGGQGGIASATGGSAVATGGTAVSSSNSSSSSLSAASSNAASKSVSGALASAVNLGGGKAPCRR